MPDYTIEKLTNALKILATHPGDARKRMIVAYLAIRSLNECDFPVIHRAEWNAIIAELTKHPPECDANGNVLRSSVERTMTSRTNRTAAKIAERLYDLYWAISENRQYR